MTWRLNTRLTQSSQWGWVELIWRLEPGNSTLTRWVSFGSGVQRPGNLPSTPPASTNIFPGGEKSALTRIRVRQSQAGSDTGLTRAKGSQTKDEPVLKQGGGGGDGEERNLALASFTPTPQRGDLVRGCSVEEVLPKTLVEKQSSRNWTLPLFLKKKMLKAGELYFPLIWCLLSACYLL